MTVFMQMTKLPASERPKALYEYSVRGQGAFPADMLRYDSCWPARSDDVATMDGRERRVIRLRSYKAPTEERWSSFGWQIVAVF